MTGRMPSAQYNLATACPELILQWDYENNEGLKPEDFTKSSGREVYWRCTFNPAHRWKARISNRTLLHRGCPVCAREFKISYPARVLLYYLRETAAGCECEAPFQKKYKIDILLSHNGERIAIEHDGFYYHENQAAQSRGMEKDRALRDAGYRVLRIKDSREAPRVATQPDGSVVYPFEERYKHLDAMVAHVLRLLDLPCVDVDHWRDYYQINQLYYLERKKRTLAVEYPELSKEWSASNTYRPDTVVSMSNRKTTWTCPDCGKEYQAAIANRVGNGSGCPYCANKKVCEENSLARKFPALAEEWHDELNAPVTARDVVPGADQSVFWRCGKGHVWEAPVYARTGKQGHGCPVCSHLRVSEEISLETLNPALAQWWHYERNAPLTPGDVTARSNQQVWWQCPEGHCWEKSVNAMHRLSPSKYCPVCNDRQVGKENSLALRNPALAKEWDRERNSLAPEQTLYNARQKVWWRRGELIWQDSVYNRNILGKDMPPKPNHTVHEVYSLATVNPALALEWNYEKNDGLTPKDISARSGKEVWWRCPEKQHEWQASVEKRHSRNFGCPYCSGRRASEEHCLAADNPALALEWHPTQNGDLTAYDVTPGSGRKIWWLCPRCGNQWQASVSNRNLRGHGCAVCGKPRKLGSVAEERPQLLAEWLYERNAVKPENCRARSNQKYWWKCKLCGHEWQTTPDARYSGSGCPGCKRHGGKP